MYKFINSGSEIESTDYFESKEAESGEFYLSINNGDARLLVPGLQKGSLKDMKHATRAEVDVYENGLEIVFEDGSAMPFLIRMAKEQVDSFADIKQDFNAKLYVYIDWGLKFAPFDMAVKYYEDECL